MPTSTSETLIALPPPVLNTRLLSSFIDWAPGTVLTGASFTAVTVKLAVPAAVLKAVVPPLVLTSTLLPAKPDVWSQAR